MTGGYSRLILPVILDRTKISLTMVRYEPGTGASWRDNLKQLNCKCKGAAYLLVVGSPASRGRGESMNFELPESSRAQGWGGSFRETRSIKNDI